MRVRPHIWIVIGLANFGFFWTLYHWVAALTRFPTLSMPDPEAYLTVQGLSLAMGFTGLWAYGYNKQVQQAGGRPPEMRERRGSFAKHPYRFLIFWLSGFLLVGGLSSIIKLLTHRPSWMVLLAYAAGLPLFWLAWGWVVNSAARPLFQSQKSDPSGTLDDPRT